MAQRSQRKKGIIFKCTGIAFVKKPKKEKDWKTADLTLTFQTVSGQWKHKRSFDETWQFLQQALKDHKKHLGDYSKKEKQYKTEFLSKQKHDNAFKLLKDVFNAVGKNRKILDKDSKMVSFIGAKRDNLSDIKGGKLMKSKKASVGSVSMLNSLANDSPPRSDPNPEVNPNPNSSDVDGGAAMDPPDNAPTAVPRTASDNQMMEIHLKELDRLKRSHIAEMHALKRENDNLKRENATQKETIVASDAARQDLESQVAQLQEETGADQIDPDVMRLWADELESLTEKYFQESKGLKKRNGELEKQVQQLTRENGDLNTKLSRAQFAAEQVATELAQRRGDNYEQLEQDYREVETELDDMTKIKERYEKTIAETAIVLDDLQRENAKMRPLYEDHPKLLEKNAQQRQEHSQIVEKLHDVEQERDDFEDKYKQTEKRLADTVPKGQLKSARENHERAMKDVMAKQSKLEHEKNEAVNELKKLKEEMIEQKVEVEQLKTLNRRLEKGGGRDINLEMSLDVENDFSIFQRDEFDFSSNLSRDQLLLWCEHFKVLIKEINDELCAEINGLSQRNEILENYIEMKGLPFPEDDNEFCQNQSEIQQILSVNDLPHPLPSMSFMEHLDSYNPTKQQLKAYIDLMFAEWRDDQMHSNQMLVATKEDVVLLQELERTADVAEVDAEVPPEQPSEDTAKANESSEDDKDKVISSLKQEHDKLYLQLEEKQLEYEQKTRELTENFEQLQKQYKSEMSKNKRPKSPSQVSGSFKDIPGMDDDADDLHADNASAFSDGVATEADANDSGMSLNTENEVEIQRLRNRLQEAVDYVKNMEDEMKQHSFEVDQQKIVLERMYKHEIDLVNLDLSDAKAQCDDLLRQIGSDDLELLASEFREESRQNREAITEVRKTHLGEINTMERQRDELLREINLLRIKTERSELDTDARVLEMEIELDHKDKELQHFSEVASDLTALREQMERIVADKEELENSYRALQDKFKAAQKDMDDEKENMIQENRNLSIKLKAAEEDIQNISSGVMDSSAIITRTQLIKMKEEMEDLRVKKTEAVKSKLGLLRISSLEIDRMRDEIRLLVGDRKVSRRDFNPGRYDSSSQFIHHPHRLSMRSESSLGSAVPLHFATHQEILHDGKDSYLTSAWTYTLGMLSSIGSVFHSANNGGADHMDGRPPNDMYRYNEYDMEQYEIETDYDGSRQSSVSPQPRERVPEYRYGDENGFYIGHNRSLSHMSNVSRHRKNTASMSRIGGHQKKHSRHVSRSKRQSKFSSMGGFVERRPPSHYNEQPSNPNLYAKGDNYHARKPSAGALRAKRNRRAPSAHHIPHQRKPSKHRTYSNMSMQSMRGKHSRRTPSKQEVLLDATDNVVVRDSMAEIFRAFDNFEHGTNVDDGMRGGSDALSAVPSGLTANVLNRFSLDDIPSDSSPPTRPDVSKQHRDVTSAYDDGFARKQRKQDEFVSGGLRDDFFTMRSQLGRDDHDGGLGNRYSDDDRFGMPTDFSGDAVVQTLFFTFFKNY